MPDTLSVLFSLIGVIAIIVFMFWAARWFQKKYGLGFGGNGKQITLEDSVSITPDTRLVIASVSGKRYLLGVGNVRLLGEISPGGVKAVSADGAGGAGGAVETDGAVETGGAVETNGADKADGAVEAGEAVGTGETVETGKKSIFTRSEGMPLGEAFKIVLQEKLAAKKED
jgi:hypothetical protein